MSTGPDAMVLGWDDPAATLARVGGKGAALARLARAGLPVPVGFHVTTAAYRAFVDAHGLADPIAAALARSDPELAAQVVQPMFVGNDVPEVIADSVRSAYSALSRGSTVAVPVAVRSSATTEDLPEASFAGQQESVLGATDPEAVLDAVRRCWASLWNGRAIAYRRWAAARDDLHDSADLVDPALAVVVQTLVPADAAGVLFTADPTTGSRDRILVDAVRGLGESLVGGRVDPDTFVVDPGRRAVADRHVSAATVRTVLDPGGGTRDETVPEQLRARPALTDAQVLALADLGTRVADLEGAPVDVEWAVQDGRCWLLQARPITRLPPDPRDLDEAWNDSLTGDFLWTSANLGEAIPSVMTPATWSLVRLFISEAMSLPRLGGRRLAGNIGGRFYLNLSIAWGVTSALGLGRPARTGMEQAFGRLPDGVVVPPLPMPRHRVIREAVAAVVPFLRRVAVYRRGLRERLEAVPQRAAALHQAVAEADAPETLRGLWGDLETLLRDTSRMLAAGSRAEGGGLVRIRPRLARLADDVDVDALMTGLVTEHDGLDSLGPLLGIAAVRRGDSDRDAYARTWGHRCPDEFEVSVPRPAEDPAWLDAQLASPTTPDRDPEVLLRRRATTRARAWERLATGHPRRAHALRRALDRAADAARARERARSEVVRTFGLVRCFILRAGALTGRGDDLFFLEIEEILAALEGDASALSHVPARRRIHERFRALGPYPMVIRGAFDPVRWASLPDRRLDLFDGTAAGGRATDAEETISGAPASAGVVDGVVRVLHHPEDGSALQAGEVLVTSVTNVGWTPLFPRAAAVVTDVGAQLSHAAIVARELGIPAVVGCGVATTRLSTGDRVRVDGGAGSVTLLP